MIARTIPFEDAGRRGMLPGASPRNPGDPSCNPGDPANIAQSKRKRRSGAGVAWLILLGAVIHPPHGWGVALCPSRWLNGLPCLGCGLSRSVSCAIRGMWSESWSYHPFGLFVLALTVVVAGFSTLPRGTQDRIFRLSRPIAPFMRGTLVLFVTAFVGFGVWRMLAELG
ncbi:MAG: DUF2752 domain-containing protein [Phycisphaerales bacterium]|nr:DUF2752 domain-containing protein [Phycisphaerales bacterium]